MNSGTAPAPWLLLGAATPSGAAFLDGLGPVAVELLGRRPPQPLLAAAGRRFRPCDLQQPRSFEGDLSGLLVSFAPIWDLAPFLAALAQDRPHALQGLRGVVACSSSSVISKRFAANRDDRELVRRLGAAEDLLLDTCTALARPARILRPTLIYGSAGGYHDRNLSRLLHLMRRLPLLPVPRPAGLRQPIHCRQLAAVAQVQARALPATVTSPLPPLAVGGDDTLSYATLLRRLQSASPPGDPARRCWLLPVPARAFFCLAAPLLALSPRRFEAVLRMGADLAGFPSAHHLSGHDAETFPMLPLAR